MTCICSGGALLGNQCYVEAAAMLAVDCTHLGLLTSDSCRCLARAQERTQLQFLDKLRCLQTHRNMDLLHEFQQLVPSAMDYD